MTQNIEKETIILLLPQNLTIFVLLKPVKNGKILRSVKLIEKIIHKIKLQELVLML